MTKDDTNISCKKATVLMSKSMEQRLSLKEKAELAGHLAVCKTCSFCFRQLKGIRKTIARYTEMIFRLPPSKKDVLSDDAKKRLKEKIISQQR